MMKKMVKFLLLGVIILALTGCDEQSQEYRLREAQIKYLELACEGRVDTDDNVAANIATYEKPKVRHVYYPAPVCRSSPHR